MCSDLRGLVEWTVKKMRDFNPGDVVVFDSKTYKILSYGQTIQLTGMDHLIYKLVWNERDTVCMFLSAFNVWLVIQSLAGLRVIRGYSSAIQITQGAITFLFSLLWVY